MFKKTALIILSIVAVAAIYSCSKKPNKDVKLSDKFAQGQPIEYEIEANDKFASIEVYNKIKPYVEKLKKQYDSVKYFTDLDTNFLFYVKHKRRMGVVDKDGRVIIPIEFDKIYNVGGTAQNCIEVETNEMRGLYAITGEKLLDAQYESIFPYVEDGNVVVQVRKKNAFGVLLENGELLFDTTGSDDRDFFVSPFISRAAANWKLNVNDESILFLQPVDFVRYENDPIEGRAIIITPSYLADLGFYPAMVSSIVIEKNADFGIAESKGKVKEVKSLWDNIKLAFAEYYEVGLDARGYETEKNSLITLNKDGDVISKIDYYRPYIPSTPCDDEIYSSKFVDSSLFEVKAYDYSEEENTYYAYNRYTYYRINLSGVITELKTDRQYTFTKFVPLTEDYIKGCFVTSQSSSEAYSDGSGKVKTQTYLTIADLEVMKNEIFAEYGYMFTKPQWREYFKKKKWYKPTQTNVDPFLTEIDRYNIAFIDNLIEKMKANPKKYNETSSGSLYLFP